MRTLRIALIGCALLAACSSKKKSGDEQRDGGPRPDAAVDASTGHDAASDGGDDAGLPARCLPEQIVEPICMALGSTAYEDEFQAGLCDGFDNDCDGDVDEGCPCEPGAVQRCFAGPPNVADVGACSSGTQTCSGGVEFAGWGQCVHGVAASKETCDHLDNDCNGCVDDGVPNCKLGLTCPGPDDPRVKAARPFQSYVLDAAQFYDGDDVVSYTWQVDGSPCDQLFAAIPNAPPNGTQSFSVTGATEKRVTMRFTLSGQYLVSLTMKRTNGEEIGCSFPLTVAGPGLRVELCWDKTGPTSGGNPVDLDLHLALNDPTNAHTTTAWRAPGSDCYYDGWLPGSLTSPGIWGHTNTPDVSACLTGNEGLDVVHEMRGNCINPRLDLDNQGETDRYLPENINLDDPRAGEVFQVAVNHRSTAAQRTRALVNVYCGGSLAGSFALDPEKTAFSDVESEDELWRVAEIAPTVDASGKTTGCAVMPLHDPMDASADWVTDGDFSISWSH